jgi:hypothetical protein
MEIVSKTARLVWRKQNLSTFDRAKWVRAVRSRIVGEEISAPDHRAIETGLMVGLGQNACLTPRCVAAAPPTSDTTPRESIIQPL